MRVILLRHATVLIDIGGQRLMVDPMLDPPGARAPVRGTPQERPNPLVPLPVTPEEAAAGVGAVLLTHTHVDHLDAAGFTALGPALPWFMQPEDMADLAPLGLQQPRPIGMGETAEWEGLRITRTGGRHGRDEQMIRGLGPVSGFVVAAEGEPSVYVAGDTVWCPEVEQALAAHDPDVVVVNAGGARFLEGGTVTMEAADVVALCAAAPRAQVVAVHMEAINHCLETRAELAMAVAEAGLTDQVAIPGDGDEVGFGA